MLQSGEMPLLTRVYDLLEIAAEQVDWILLGFYAPFGSELKSSAIIRCLNGMFRTSAARQGLRRTEFAGSEKVDLLGHRKTVDVRSVISGDDVEFFAENPFATLGADKEFNDAMRGALEALNFCRRKQPFAATATVQMLFELVRGYAKPHKGDFDAADMARLIRRITPGQFDAWWKQFAAKHELADASDVE